MAISASSRAEEKFRDALKTNEKNLDAEYGRALVFSTKRSEH